MFCNALTNYWIFDAVIILLILFSTITLAFEHPLEDPNSEQMKTLETERLVLRNWLATDLEDLFEYAKSEKHRRDFVPG